MKILNSFYIYNYLNLRLKVEPQKGIPQCGSPAGTGGSGNAKAVVITTGGGAYLNDARGAWSPYRWCWSGPRGRGASRRPGRGSRVRIRSIAVPLAGPTNDVARETASALAAKLGATLCEPSAEPVDLIVVGSQPGASASHVVIGGDVRNELDRARSSVLVLAAGVPLIP